MQNNPISRELGNLLHGFNCDLPYCSKTSDVAMYAVDTTIYYSSPSIDDINASINADLEALRCWLEGNKLSQPSAEEL